MSPDRIERLRGLVMFVVAWLIGLYVFEIVRQSFSPSVGFVAALLTLAVNIYARRRAVASVEATTAFKFWMNLPIILFLVLPIVIKIVAYFWTDEKRTVWTHIESLVPPFLKLGVPVVTLLWVYFSLGRMLPAKKVEESEATDAT